MFKHLLVPLDGSELGERALSPAVSIAEAMTAKITLFRVVPQYAILAADPMLYEEMNRLGEDESLAYLRATADALDVSLPVDVVCEIGQPADSIIQFAEEHEVDLIVMSSHGRSGLDRWVYGSVAERVLQQAPCATAIINTRAVYELPEKRRILIPLDGSELAERALGPAKELAQALNAELYLLRVTSSDHQILETSSMKEVFDEIEGREKEEATEYLMSKCSDISLEKVFCEASHTTGSVAEAILDYAAAKKVDMIVMSSHGRTGLQRWVYGSVAEKVLRSACCATMIIRNLKA